MSGSTHLSRVHAFEPEVVPASGALVKVDSLQPVLATAYLPARACARGAGGASLRERKGITGVHKQNRARLVALGAAFALVLASVGTSSANDTVFPDGDTGSPPPNIQYGATANHACDTRGDWVDGDVKISYNGGAPGHYAANEFLAVTFAPDAGATVELVTANPQIPSDWNDNTDTYTFAIRTKVGASQADGTYQVEVTVHGNTSGYEAGSGAGSGKPKYNVSVSCSGTIPSNQPPVIGTMSFNPNPVDCQSSTTLTIPFTDADSTSWYAEIDWNYDLSTFDVDATTAVSDANPITASHTYAAPGTYTAGAIVYDDAGAASNVGTASVLVNQAYTAAFQQPIDASNNNNLIRNTMKAGRVVPIKVTITDTCTGLPVTSGNVTISVKKGTTVIPMDGTDAIETYSDAGASNGTSTSFRWDATGGLWIYNLDSGAKGWGLAIGSTYYVYVNVDGIAATQFAILTPVK